MSATVRARSSAGMALASPALVFEAVHVFGFELGLGALLLLQLRDFGVHSLALDYRLTKGTESVSGFLPLERIRQPVALLQKPIPLVWVAMVGIFVVEPYAHGA